MSNIHPPNPLSVNMLWLTQSAAISSFKHIGLGNTKMADQAAVNAMRQSFQKLPLRGKIAIGEGERDTAPMLYIGEKVGMWGNTDPELDVAVDPLEGTNLCAKGLNGSISVLSVSQAGNLFTAPDLYMEKIACGPLLKGLVSLRNSPEENIKKAGEILNKPISEVTVSVLDRPRHKGLIKSIYKTGARVNLIEDGDLSTAIMTSWPAKGSNIFIDLVMGSGGAPEGVLAASALKCLGGDFQGRLIFKTEDEKERARDMGIEDFSAIYYIEDLVKDWVLFCASGVTTGPLLKGVMKNQNKVEVESLYMDSKSKQCSIICSTHFL